MSNELNILISNITSFDFQKFNSGVFYLTLSHRKIDLLLSMMMPHARLVSGLWTNQRPVCTWLSCSIRQDTTCHPPPGSASVPLKEKIVGCYVKNILVFCCHLPFSSTGSARQSIMTWVCLSKESSAFLHLSDTTTTTLVSGFCCSDTSRMRQWMVCPWRWVLVSLQSFHHLASDLLYLGHALPRNLAPIPDVLLEAEEDLRQLHRILALLDDHLLAGVFLDLVFANLIKPPSASKSCAIIFCLLVSCWHFV